MADKPQIVICMGSSCFARGNNAHLNTIETFLSDNCLDADIVLTGSRCEDQCAMGPNIVIDGVTYRGLNEELLRVALRKHFLEEAVH